MHIFYRYSDNSYEKPKLPVSKRVCLSTAAHGCCRRTDRITLIADNTKPREINWLLDIGPHHYHETKLGNAGSFLFALDLALELADEEIVYFVEDDYVHCNEYHKTIKDAPADYWTLYDHPDKYSPSYNLGENRKVFRTRHCTWRHSISTTMTFATKVKTLRQDQHIWRDNCKGQHPNDHFAFLDLAKKENRTLAVAIPGKAVHTALDCVLACGRERVDYGSLRMVLEQMRDWSRTRPPMQNEESFYKALHNRIDEAEDSGDFSLALVAFSIAAAEVERVEKFG